MIKYYTITFPKQIMVILFLCEYMNTHVPVVQFNDETTPAIAATLNADYNINSEFILLGYSLIPKELIDK